MAWIWSFIWHLPLDLIKWGMAYVLNEDGFRDRMHGRQPSTIADSQAVALPEAGPDGSPAGPGEARPSVARTSLGRTSAGARPNIGRTSVQVGATTS